MTTISIKTRKSNNVSDVKRWQKILGFTGDNIDGDFGKNTDEKTRDWQSAKKLVPDGVVGKSTWAAAGVVSDTPIQVSPAVAANDKKAYEIAKSAAPTMPEVQRQYALAVARGEGRYGLGWATPSAATIKKANEYGLTGYEGKGSNNWGAVQGKGNAGSFTTVDYGWKIQPDGSKKWEPYTYSYRRYLTPEDGFLDMARILLKPNVKEALAKKDLKGAVMAQHSNKYFELDPEKYFTHVKNNYEALTKSIGWETLLIKHGLSLVSIVLGAATALIVGIFAFGRLQK